MPAQRRGLGLMRLVATDGHSHWAEPELRIAFDGTVTVAVPCDLGGVPMLHYVGRDVRGVACWDRWPYTFASIADAEAARDELAAQQPNEGE